MKQAKFIEVLKTFSPPEFKKFGLLVKSPYFNSEKVLMQTFDILKKHYPEFKAMSLEKEKLFMKLYPGKQYNDTLMRNIFSDMLGLAEQFLILQFMREEKLDNYIILMNEYGRRNIYNLAEKNMKKGEYYLENQNIQNADYYRNKLKFVETAANLTKMMKDVYVRKKDFVQSVSDNTAAVFLIEMLHSNLEMLNRKTQIFDLNYSLNFEDEIDSFLSGKGKRFLEIPYIKYNYYTFKLTHTGEEKYFYLLRDFADKDFEKLSQKEKKDVFTVLTNYCYKRITRGEDFFIKEQFTLYTLQVDKNIYKSTGEKVSNVFFMNVVTTGLESGVAEWVKRFVADKQHELKDESRADTINFCNALISYYERNYRASLTELSKVTTEDMTYKHNIRSLYLKLYFDMNEIEPFLSHIDSYKHFISKNPLVYGKIKDQVNNYINFSSRIFCIKNSIGKFDEFDVSRLRKELIECKSIINKSWLIERAEKLLKTQQI